MKAPLLFTGLYCVCLAACGQRHLSANNEFQKSADTAATAYKTASDVDAAYENNKISEWRASQDGRRSHYDRQPIGQNEFDLRRVSLLSPIY